MMELDDLALAAALKEDHETLAASAPVPPPALVFWRATIRARADAARVAERPITFAQSFAATCVIAVALMAVGAIWNEMPSLVTQHALMIVLTLAFCLLVAPIAVFVALSD
ncbi:MAG TPA: hypothetical protein VFA59_04485 [Vicinamibacterales bacterium]|nr:hypothetical protein [Vicinamibacterales bacterium]